VDETEKISRRNRAVILRAAGVTPADIRKRLGL